MTVTELLDRIDNLIAAAGDPEAAHGMEDDIHHAVLVAIAEGRAEDPVKMARLAASTGSIEFERWYA